MADILRFDPLGPPSNPDWRRFPRFEEVGAQIDAQANRSSTPAPRSTAAAMLDARVEQSFRPKTTRCCGISTRPSPCITSEYEHAAYLVGLRAGAGRLPGLCAGPRRRQNVPRRPETRLDVGRPAILFERAPDLVRARQRRLPLRDVLAAIEPVVEEEHQRRLGCARNERRARPAAVGMPEPPQDSRFRVGTPS